MPTGTSQRGGTRHGPTAPGKGAAAQGGTQKRGHDHEGTLTIPLDRMAAIAGESVMAACRALSSRGGLPVYAGLGVLAAADVIVWPAAVVAGAGYAVLRRWGPFGQHVSRPAGAVGLAGRSAPSPATSPAAAQGRGKGATPQRAPAADSGRTSRAGAGPARTRKPGTGPRARP